MNAFQLAKSAYSPIAAPMRSAQNTEYAAFAIVTRRLQEADSPTELAQAILDNRELWSLLAVDVADPNNRLPASLRAQIFYLYEFSSAHSRRVLSGTATVDALVDVNSAIMAGLRQQGEAT